MTWWQIDLVIYLVGYAVSVLTLYPKYSKGEKWMPFVGSLLWPLLLFL